MCGCSSDDEARFCRDCGRPLDELESGFLLLDSQHDEISDSVVRRGGSPKNFWLPIAAIALVVVLGWGIQAALRSPPTDTPESASGEAGPGPQTTKRLFWKYSLIRAVSGSGVGPIFIYSIDGIGRG